MITIEKIKSADYLIEHSKHEYLTESDSQKGYFAGTLMKYQRLEGKEVDEKTFKRMLNYGKDGFSGVEITPAPPKDFSILLERADPQLRAKLEALDDLAINNTIKAIEQNTYYRKTENGKTTYHLAKAAAFARFSHYTSRPTIDENGNTKIDMQKHTHIIGFPKVLGQDGKFHSHTLLEAKYEKHNDHETLRYFDQVYQSTIAKGLQEMGYSIERGKKDSFKIKGISDELVKEFSTRTKQAEDKVGKDASYQDKKKASLRMRNKKVVSDLADLRPLWQKRMDDLGFTKDKIESIKDKQQNKDLSFDEIFKDKAIISKKEMRIKALSESKFSTKTSAQILDEFKQVKIREVSKNHYTNLNNKLGKALTPKAKPQKLNVGKGGQQKQISNSHSGKASDNIQVSLNNLKSQYQSKMVEVAMASHSKPGREAKELLRITSEYSQAESELNSQLAQALAQESKRSKDMDI